MTAARAAAERAAADREAAEAATKAAKAASKQRTADALHTEKEMLQALAQTREDYRRDQYRQAQEVEKEMQEAMTASLKHYDQVKKAQQDLDRLSIENKLAEVDAQEKFYQLTSGAAAEKRIALLQESLALENAAYLAVQGTTSIEELERAKILKVITDTNNKLLDQQLILKDTTAWGAAQSAMQEYARMAADIGQQTKNVVTDFFKGMEDALVEFVRHGAHCASRWVSHAEADPLDLCGGDGCMARGLGGRRAGGFGRRARRSGEDGRLRAGPDCRSCSPSCRGSATGSWRR